jgi:hypothetical protein
VLAVGLMARTESARPLRAYFCSICGALIGVLDNVRIQHEHFDLEPRCRGGRFRIVEYAPTGRDLAEVDRARSDIYSSGFRDGYKRALSDQEHGRKPPWSVREHV